MEKRYFNVELRAEEGKDNVTVTGHGAVFNQEANIGWFYERVQPGAFDEAIKSSDIRALKNHDPNFVLGRTKSNTLRVGTDNEGLTYSYDSPDTSYAKDLIISMRRGDIDQSSYAFTLKRKDEDGENGDKWEEDENGKVVRTILPNGVKRLYDVSVVTYPAFEGAGAKIQNSEARSSYEAQTGKKLGEADKTLYKQELTREQVKNLYEEGRNETLEQVYESIEQKGFELIKIEGRKAIVKKQTAAMNEIDKEKNKQKLKITARNNNLLKLLKLKRQH